jgi:uncharacterized protein YbjT (DUF2867 family)
MKVLVTGGTGFTGSHTVSLLIKEGVEVRCLSRPTSDRSQIQQYPIEWVQGDLADKASLQSALVGMDALINIASLGFGHAPIIVDAALSAGIKRAIFISTTALFTNLNAPSKQVRLAAEQTIRQSELDYTILRPTMIYGTRHDRNMSRLIRFIMRSPVIPIIGNGRFLQQPVYVQDVSQAIVKSLMNPGTSRKSYNISGGEPLTYNEVIDTICTISQRRRLKIHLPAKPIIAVLRLLEKASIRLPVKAEQVERLNENKAFSFDEAHADFDYTPRTFAEGITSELGEMGVTKSS